MFTQKELREIELYMEGYADALLEQFSRSLGRRLRRWARKEAAGR